MTESQRLAAVRPSERQLNWQELEFYAFFHYGTNTYTDREWGDGTADPNVFRPDALDTDQWVAAAKAAEMKAVIFTAKHHDGFCLWDTKTTNYNVMHSPFGKDIVKLLSESCRKYGMKFGVYLSPWDRNCPLYGSDKYNDYFIAQLDELLSNYGDVFCVWFDGACGEGPNGKKQIYDWQRFYSFVREKQPGAVISISGPDVRWCGNEAGQTRPSEWSVVPARLSKAEIVASLSQQDEEDTARLRNINSKTVDLGSREALRDEPRLIWYPCEVDTSIRPGWFYHSSEDDKVRSLDELLNIYLSAVGGNAALLLNIPPDRHGRISDPDLNRLREIGEFIRSVFSENLASDAEITVGGPSCPEIKADALKDSGNTSVTASEENAVITVKFPEERSFNYITLMEDISMGQRIESFSVYTKDSNKPVYLGTTVGHKKICRLPITRSDTIRIEVTSSRCAPILRYLGVHYGREIPSFGK